MIEIKATIDPITDKISIQRGATDPMEELDNYLAVVSVVAKRAMKYQEMNKRDMVNYCGNYLKGKI